MIVMRLNGYFFLLFQECKFGANIYFTHCTIDYFFRQSRSPPILPLSFTLAGFPSPSHIHATIPTLYNVLSLILPVVTNVPLSLEMLNKTSFKPTSKDEDLHSGWMQLPQGSVCTVSENGVTEGTIVENGQSFSLSI